MNKMLKVILPVMLISVLLIAGCPGNSEPDISRLGSIIDCEEYTGGGFKAGDPAPDFHFQNADGQTVALSDFRGEVVLINFWAYWCGPCVYEMPFIQQVYEEWQEKGLVLLSIHIGEDAEKAASFIEEYNLSFPVLMDIEGIVATQYGATSIPTTFLIDKEGLIQGIKVGRFSSVEEIEGGISLFITE
jgi:peroxiredoxin